MPASARKPSPSDFYHVVIRGVAQQIIFEDDRDRMAMYDAMHRILGEENVVLFAWCMMSNHVHLLVRASLADMAQFMKRVELSYVAHFNARHGRTGHLFQGRYHSEPIMSDEQLLATVRYIHQNPWKAGIARSCDFAWSSYREYVGVPRLVEVEFVKEMLDGMDGLEEFHSYADFDAKVFDVDELSTPMTDEDAREIAAAVIGETALREILSMEKVERDEALRALKHAGLSVRCVARLTGVGRGAVERA